MHHGHLDAPRLLELIGWAWDPSRPGARLRVELTVDGEPLRRVTAAGFRPDLLDAGIGDGRHAFSLELPRRVFDGRMHTLAATIGGQHLGASPMRFQSRYAGEIAETGDSVIRGTLRDLSRPDLPARLLTAEVHADGRFLGWARTMSSGGDFEIPVPEGFDTARVRYYELFAKGCSKAVARRGKPPLMGWNPLRSVWPSSSPAEREVTVRDYSWICPRGDFIDETGLYCGEPSNLAACERCLRTLGPRPGWGYLLHRYGSVAELRAASRRTLGEKAAVVHFPSREALERIARYVPEVRAKARIAEPECAMDPGPAPRPPLRSCGRLPSLPPQPPPEVPVARTGDPQVKGRPADPVIDIIVPVYRGVEETLGCIRSVLASRQPSAAPFELIAILDQPDDGGEMLRALEEQQSRTPFTLLRNDRNLGFVRTANRGLALHPSRDVVLLNSDTLVSSSSVGWLDRLRDAAYAQPHTGTATPFSNNATICSYPRFSRDNPLPAGHTVDTLDALCRERLAGRTIDIPVAVGFCMYIRRDCLDQTGLFDEETFGRGYGEENDFCMRAARLGWTHVLAASVFVQHLGGLSFAAETRELIRANGEKLNAKHPEYPALVDSFLRRDPVRPLRRELDWARLSTMAAALGPVHCVATNTLPGGTERHVAQRAAEVRAADPQRRVVIVRYSSTQAALEIDGAPPVDYPNLAFDLPAERAALREMLADRLGVARMHIHQIVDAPLAIFELGIPYDITVHDYGWICPQVTLQREDWRYCGEPEDIGECERCYARLGPHKDWGSLAAESVAAMRRQNVQILERAGTVWFPSDDARQRMLRYAPGIGRAVADPPQKLPGQLVRRWRREGGGRARVAYIGSLGYAKGYHVLYGLALDALKRDLPVDFHVIGGTAESEPLLDLGVRIHGPYEESEAVELIEAVRPHVALFPGLLPESFSYTLTLAMEQGVWPVAFDLGAIAGRIREAGFGSLAPLGASAAELNDLLLREA